MRILAESLKRLYERGRVTKKQVAERVANGKITKEEYEVITGEFYLWE